MGSEPPPGGGPPLQEEMPMEQRESSPLRRLEISELPKVVPLKLQKTDADTYRVSVDAQVSEEEGDGHGSVGNGRAAVTMAALNDALAEVTHAEGGVDGLEVRASSSMKGDLELAVGGIKAHLSNFLTIAGSGREMLDEGLEIPGCELPQSRVHQAEYINLVLSVPACGYRCPVKTCTWTLFPYEAAKKGEKNRVLVRDKDRHLMVLDETPKLRASEIMEHWEQNHFPSCVSGALKVNCPFVSPEGDACSAKVVPRANDLRRHIHSVHGEEGAEVYDVRALCLAVQDNYVKRPQLPQITSERLEGAYSRGMAIRSGCVRNMLSVSGSDGSARPLKRKHDPQGVKAAAKVAPTPAPSQSVQRSSRSSRREPSSSSARGGQSSERSDGFSVVGPKKQRTGSGHSDRRSRRGEGNVAPCAQNPSRHGSELPKCNQPSAKSNRTSAWRATELRKAEEIERVRLETQARHDRARAAFTPRRDALAKLCRGLTDRVQFLPSMPASGGKPVHFVSYEKALVEMADLTRRFLCELSEIQVNLLDQCAVAHPRVQRGEHFTDDLARQIVARSKEPARGVAAPRPAVIAAAAGAPHQLAVNAIPAVVTYASGKGPGVKMIEKPLASGISFTWDGTAPSGAHPNPTPGFTIPRLRSEAAVTTGSADRAQVTEGGGKGVAAGSMVAPRRDASSSAQPLASSSVAAGAPSTEPVVKDRAREPSSHDQQVNMVIDTPQQEADRPINAGWHLQVDDARGLMSHLTGMIDILLTGPLASECGEAGRAFIEKCLHAKPPNQE